MTTAERTRRHRLKHGNPHRGTHSPVPPEPSVCERCAGLAAKLDAARSRVAELEGLRNQPEDIERRVQEEVAKAVPEYQRAYAQAQMIVACHDGIMPRKEFVKILARLAPDAEPGDNVRNAEAFKIFKGYEKALCKPEPKRRPPGAAMPTTAAEWMALRREVRAKNSERAKRGAETRKARSRKAPRLAP